ncbi:DNA-directed RNA polymerase I core subunit [Martiniozyma asiatica (nom. inval.)]|nr:DNA-directed RNA polymerase I core subunit [Martiniozyma asiatica]
MNIAKPVGSEISHVDFSVLSVDEIRKLSAKQVTNPVVFDTLGHPISGGLYDPRLGAFLRNLCGTCGLDDRSCPGHQGHIELPIPCYNPIFFNQLYIFLRSACVHCYHFKISKVESHLIACKLQLLQFGLILEASEIDKVRPDDSNFDFGNVNDDDEEDNAIKMSDSESEKWRQVRDLYVYESINNALKDGQTTKQGVFTATVGEARKAIILDIYKKMISRKKCSNCEMFSPTFRNDGVTKIFQNALNDKDQNHNRVKSSSKDKSLLPYIHHIPKAGSKYMLSSDVRNLMKQLFKVESNFINFLFNSKPMTGNSFTHDMFFIIALVVPPTRFRLPSKVGDEVNENSQNQSLSNILKSCMIIRDLNEQFSMISKESTVDDKKAIFNRLMNAFVYVQNEVNGFIDSTKNQNSMSKNPIPGIKQALEKKEGLFRKHMMGKRVNYAARSVISPDPMLETNQIGVPPVFAVKLTYPEPVTSYNFAELRQAVINGPDKWPGATAIEMEDGKLISLNMSPELRKTYADQLLTNSGNSINPKKVHRHIKNNDVVLMNRQPTLHKASMMGHKVRVLPGEKTLRLHYANTGAYNADFDGDEMNMHFPQNENARAEAFNLANTDSQYLTPTSGSPVRGLIQDHISAGVWLTNKDTFFTREKYQELIYSCIRPEDGHSSGLKIETLPPTIFKPVPLWTGKQIISTILLNIKPQDRPGINLLSKNKIKNEYWGENSNENEVLFKDGQLLNGILDKSQYGASKYGIIHSLHEVYGSDVAGKALSVLGRLFTTYIMMIGFTCGMDDLRLTVEGNQWRDEILSNNVDVGREAAAEVANLDKNTKSNNTEFKKRLEEILRDDNKLAILDAVTMSKVNAVTTKVVSTCVPNGTMKKFPNNSMQAMALSGAKGSNVNVSQIMCMLGQQALEGRRVPVMVSGKTLPCFKPFETDARAGGYIKNRFYSGVRPQEYYFHCMAGREGLIDTAVKTANSGYLQRCLTKQLEGVTVNYDNTVRNSDGTMVQFVYGGDSIDTIKESHMYEFKFFVDNYNSLLQKYSPSKIDNLDAEEAIHYNKKMRKHLKKQGQVSHFEESDKYDPTISVYNPSRFLGSVSDKFEEKLDVFIENNDKLFVSSKEAKLNGGLTSKKFKALMQLKYMRSVIHPGEAVGIIASQSVGEPSTQMTLNTFHFAGHGAANVTLGIPRLREIVMTASASIKTPTMNLPLLKDIDDDSANAFCKSVTKINFSEFIDDVEVVETTADVSAGANATRSYEIGIKFFDCKDYENEYDVTKEELELVVRRKFISQLETILVKELKKQKKAKASLPDIAVAAAKASTTSKIASDEGSDELSEKNNSKQAVSYDGPDDEELDVMREAEKSDEELVNSGNDSDSDSESDSDSDSDRMDVDSVSKKSITSSKSKLANIRQQEVIIAHNFVTQYDFDDESGSWCNVKFELSAETEKLLMVNIVEEACKSCVVREVSNIGRCLHSDGDRHLVTEGVNFKSMWEYDSFLNVDGITSNDVAAMLKTYGVEAARNTIVNEINRVFATYAISVSSRHLDLIADYMTREGSYLAFNRQGIDSCTSSFMKMSYETTCGFLTKAVLNGDREELDSPSARLVMGKLNKAGTGAFDLLAKM